MATSSSSSSSSLLQITVWPEAGHIFLAPVHRHSLIRRMSSCYPSALAIRADAPSLYIVRTFQCLIVNVRLGVTRELVRCWATFWLLPFIVLRHRCRFPLHPFFLLHVNSFCNMLISRKELLARRKPILFTSRKGGISLVFPSQAAFHNWMLSAVCTLGFQIFVNKPLTPQYFISL